VLRVLGDGALQKRKQLKWALVAKATEDEITGQSLADNKLSTRERGQRGDESRETAGKRPTAMCDLRKKVVQSGLAGKTGKHHVAKAVR
jgi:hypothetical protein